MPRGWMRGCWAAVAMTLTGLASHASAQSPPLQVIQWHAISPPTDLYDHLWILAVPGGFLLKSLDASGEQVTFIPGDPKTYAGLQHDPLTGWNVFDGYFLHLTQVSPPSGVAGGDAQHAGDTMIPLNKVTYIENKGSAGSIVHVEGPASISVKESSSQIWHSITNRQ
jgi:hypothetical protein